MASPAEAHYLSEHRRIWADYDAQCRLADEEAKARKELTYRFFEEKEMELRGRLLSESPGSHHYWND